MHPSIDSKTFSVCLVNPPVLAVLEPWYDEPDFVRTGLAYLAGYLRKYESFEIKIIDAKFERLNFEETLELIKECEPDLVGFTAFTNEIKPAAYLSALVKSFKSSINTVIGGVHVSALPKQTLEEFPSFDLGIFGEGEKSLLELCLALKNNLSIDSIKGVVHRTNNEITVNDSRERVLNQDEIPMPAWDLLPKAKTYYIQTIRGCPYNCSFCMNPNGKIARKNSVDKTILELNYLIEQFKPERISFGDELFSVDFERTKALLTSMIKHDIGKKVKWDVQTHVNHVNDELFQLFKNANVDRVELGIETGDESKLKKMGKGTKLSNIMLACETAKKNNVEIGIFMLFGHPNETKVSINKTINLAAKLNPSLPMFGLMTPYPGTEVAAYAAENKYGYRLLTTDWDEYNKQIGGAMEFVNLTRRQIEWLQVKAYLLVYLKNYRFLDLIKFIWQFRKGAWQVLRKILLNKSSLNEISKRPKDYNKIVSQGISPSISIFETSRKEWKHYQNNSLKALKKQLQVTFNQTNKL